MPERATAGSGAAGQAGREPSARAAGGARRLPERWAPARELLSKLRGSLTLRLVVVVICAELLLASGGVIAAVVFTRQQLLGAFDAALHARAMTAIALVRYNESPPTSVYFDASLLPRARDAQHPDLYEITTTAGDVVARSAGWQALTPPARDRFKFRRHGVPYGAIVLRNVEVLDREEDAGPPVRLNVIYASPLLEARQRTRAAGMYVGLASLLLLVATGLLGYWGVRRGLAPLRDIAGDAASITAHHLEVNWSPRARHTVELVPLVAALETMLARLGAAARQQREFVADAAHELKTPVAVIKASLQWMLQRPRSEDVYRSTAEGALEDIDRLEALVARMLRLARVEQMAAGEKRELASIDLDQTCEAAVARLRPLAELREITIRLERDGSTQVRADSDDLELVWTNLLDNALKHSPGGSMIELCVTTSPEQATVTVRDQGRGIPEEELPHIFERFHRGDASRARQTGGYGLGLAISKAIIHAYGGSIEAASVLGRGTTVSVRLPVAKQERPQAK